MDSKQLIPPTKTSTFSKNNIEMGCFGDRQFNSNIESKRGCKECKEEYDCWKETGKKGSIPHNKAYCKESSYTQSKNCIHCISGGRERRRFETVAMEKKAMALWKKGIVPESATSKFDKSGNPANPEHDTHILDGARSDYDKYLDRMKRTKNLGAQ